jgi:hypothetical protein
MRGSGEGARMRFPASPRPPRPSGQPLDGPHSGPYVEAPLQVLYDTPQSNEYADPAPQGRSP